MSRARIVVRLGLAACALAALASAPAAQSSRPAATQPAGNGVVEGRVLGPLGEPLVGVEVWAAVWPELDKVVARTRTDGDGMFVLGKVPLKLVWLFAKAPGLTTARGFFNLTAEGPAGSGRLRLWEAIAVRGRVLDPEGKPLPGATVLGTQDLTQYDGGFRSPEAVTDAEGSFEVAGLPIGDCVLRQSAPFEVAPGKTVNQDLRLE